MKTVGIIAEYNPFHNGHAHQISFLKEQGAEIIVAALSGCFVQRGMPAWTDKYLRTKMALAQGVDFVFELPVLYALSSAEGFAFGGVSLLNALPLEGFCFGSESGKLEQLQTIADFLVSNDKTKHHTGYDIMTEENDSAGCSSSTVFQKELQSEMKKGVSFPYAREKALRTVFPDFFQNNPMLVAAPNNILALEYLKACRILDSKLQPVTLLRNDHGYLETNLEPGTVKASAMAIRSQYKNHRSLDVIKPSIPETTYNLLKENPNRFSLDMNDFSDIVYTCLRREKSPENYTSYGEISPDLAMRFWKHLPEFTSFWEYSDLIRRKNFTYTRIFRSLMHITLGITKEQLERTKMKVPYLRLLGMNKEKSAYLRKIKKLPLITKVADYEKILIGFYEKQDTLSNAQKQSRISHALDCFRTDLLAADIYRQTLYHKLGVLLPDEFHNGIEIY